MGIDAILAIGGLVIPPVVDFVKKKFLNEKDTPEQTLSTLATTKPDVMPSYIEAQSKLLLAQKEYFNRDVCGTPSQIIVNLRAAIRPVGVVLSFIILSVIAIIGVQKVDFFDNTAIQGVRYACIAICTSWFGDRIAK